MKIIFTATAALFASLATASDNIPFTERCETIVNVQQTSTSRALVVTEGFANSNLYAPVSHFEVADSDLEVCTGADVRDCCIEFSETEFSCALPTRRGLSRFRAFRRGAPLGPDEELCRRGVYAETQ